MLDFTMARLKSRLYKWSVFPLTLQKTVVVAKHLVLSGLWYLLTLNAVQQKCLHCLQQLIVSFLGEAGTPMSSTGCLPVFPLDSRTMEVLACLMFLSKQVPSDGHWTMFLFWQPGHHFLKIWINAQLTSLSQALFEVPNYGCLFLCLSQVHAQFSLVLSSSHSHGSSSTSSTSTSNSLECLPTTSNSCIYGMIHN
jgi:hypothetical protein